MRKWEENENMRVEPGMILTGFLLSAFVMVAGCTGVINLWGDGDETDLLSPGDGGYDNALTDGDPGDHGTDEDSGMDEGGDDDVDEDGMVEDAGPNCPIWAIPSPTGGLEDGSEAHPFAGLRRALEARGTCDTIILRGGTLESPFDAAVDVTLAAGETLTIQGDSATEALAELDAHDNIGLFVTGNGTLILRHLAVRNGWGTAGGCLDAEVHALRLEDIELSDCRADAECGAARVRAGEITISDSRFLRNDVVGDAPATTWPYGVLCLDGPPDTTHILVERCRFEDNHLDMGSALSLQALTLDAVVRDCVFIRNRSRLGPSALGGTLGELSHNRFEANEVEDGWAIVGVDGTPETRIMHNLFIGNRSDANEMGLTVSRGLVANNLFVRNTCGNTLESSRCIPAVWIQSTGSVDLRNNTFVDNANESGIAHLSYNSVFGQVRSNLFVGGAGQAAVGMENPDWGVSVEMSYNAWWNVPEPVWGDGIRLGDGNIEADPLFTGGDDFRLGAGSAAIDAGDPDPLLADPDDTRNDIGAFGGPEGDWTPLSEGGVP